MKKKLMQMKFLKMKRTEKYLWVPKPKCEADLIEEKDCSAFYPL
jgi:hypothetical protein